MNTGKAKIKDDGAKIISMAIKRHAGFKRRRVGAVLLSAAVLFVSSYAMMRPAVTMDGESYTPQGVGLASETEMGGDAAAAFSENEAAKPLEEMPAEGESAEPLEEIPVESEASELSEEIPAESEAAELTEEPLAENEGAELSEEIPVESEGAELIEETASESEAVGLTEEETTSSENLEIAVLELSEGMKVQIAGTVEVGACPVEPAIEPETAGIRVKKIVTGAGGDAYQLFHFSLNIVDGGTKPLPGTYQCFYNGTEKTIVVDENGDAHFTLRSNGVFEMTGIQSGFYYIVSEDEANQGGYTTTVERLYPEAQNDEKGGVNNWDPQADGVESETYPEDPKYHIPFAEIIFTNNKDEVTSYVLPETGGGGIGGYIKGGTALVFASLALLYITLSTKKVGKREEERRSGKA